MTKGFFTDTTLCIGCKACEVACKQWNQLPGDGYTLSGMSYDNTEGLSATTWRHVAFVEQFERPLHDGQAGLGERAGQNGHGARDGRFDQNGQGRRQGADAVSGRIERADSGGLSVEQMLQTPRAQDQEFGGFLMGNRWLMMSDVCKHCTNAACLEACPTGAIIRNEFGDVYVQPDICNGCGYCVSACPFGVVALNKDDGRAWKCTLCYDRQKEGMEPACAKACPTQSIQFGDLDELHERAARRVGMLHERGVTDAYLYGADEHTTVGDLNAFFLLVDKPAVYNLPEKPHLAQAQVLPAYAVTVATGALLGVASVVAFLAKGAGEAATRPGGPGATANVPLSRGGRTRVMPLYLMKAATGAALGVAAVAAYVAGGRRK